MKFTKRVRLRQVKLSVRRGPIVFALAGGASTAIGDPLSSTIVMSGQLAPGTSGATFDELSPGVINDTGEVVFAATLQADGQGVTPANNSGIWVDRGGVLSLVVREGDMATPAATFGDFRLVGAEDYRDINAEGDIYFKASLDGAGGEQSIWESAGGVLTKIARTGEIAPGTTGVYESLGDPVLGDHGELAFGALLAIGVGGVSPDNQYGIWGMQGGTPVLIARTGSGLPGSGGAVEFFDGYSMAPNGELFLSASFAPVPGVWAWHGSAVSAHSPGAALYLQHGCNSRRDVFGADGSSAYAHLYNEGTMATSPVGIAIDNAPAPGTSAAFDFAGLWGYVITRSRGVAFCFQVYSPAIMDFEAYAGLWSRVNESAPLELVARGASPAVGVPGAVYDRPTDFFGGPYWSYAMNATGDLVIHGYLLQGVGGVDGTNDQCLWVRDGMTGRMTLRHRTGDVVDVNDDPLTQDLRTISSISFVGASGMEDGCRSGLNENRQFVYRLQFTDGTSGFQRQSVSGTGQPCLADLDGDGDVDPDDIAAFVNAFTDAIADNADIDGDGDEDPDDIAAFVDAFIAGCG